MIEVFVKKDGQQIARIQIENITNKEDLKDGFGDYEVKFAVERGNAVSMHRRLIFGFPRKRYNVLALVRQALHTLEERELYLERDFDPDEAPVSPDLARRLGRALRSIQAGKR